ncbi:APC family permease [Aurantibacillus circumpalustris]|uniref:APC family permease n=1 Tax=Aurantibacillus circumpalustris TaxID=3036359 RepID=UPI00295BD54A|nr:amino acid permease [Aurantibacillus circumpalustris]
MSELKRSLNLFDTIMLVSGSMIGSGVFIVAADMTRVLGSPFWVLMCWVISGIITLFAALSYGELAGMMPEAGGQFIYLKRAYGKLTSFVYGWTVFTVIQTGVIAAVAVAFARYVGVFIPFFDESNSVVTINQFSISTTQLLGVVSIVFLTYLNSLGINNGRIIQRIFTSTKLLALFGLIILGFAVGYKSGYWQTNIELPFKNETFATKQNGFSAIALMSAMGVALIGSLFSSDAWNNVTFIAGEIKEPQKNIPIGLLVGVLLVTVLYILANIAYFMLLPALGSPDAQTVIGKGIEYAQNDRVGSAAMYPVFGDVSSYIMALLIVISTFGCNNGLILSGARLFQAMANEGLFFKSASHINKFDVPSKALWFQAFWSSVLCLSGSYGSLLDYCTFASLLFYIVTISALFYLRKKEPDAPRPYKAFGYPIIPALYILLAGAICLDLLIYKPQNTFLGLVIIALGLPVYYFFNKSKNASKFSE